MGLTRKRAAPPRTYLSINMSADWPIRIFYGLMTAYQGLFGLFVPSSIFHQALQSHLCGVLVIAILLVTGALLTVDGFLAMVRYCTPLKCSSLMPAMSVFDRRRPWLFLPPAFCYFVTLVLVKHQLGTGATVVSIYYVLLGFAGVIFCLRDGMVGQNSRGSHA